MIYCCRSYMPGILHGQEYISPEIYADRQYIWNGGPNEMSERVEFLRFDTEINTSGLHPRSDLSDLWNFFFYLVQKTETILQKRRYPTSDIFPTRGISLTEGGHNTEI